MAGLTKIKTSNFKGYLVGGEAFRTKKAVAERTRKIMSAYDVEQELAEADLQFVVALLQNHPRYDDKVGVGIAAIKVIGHGEFGGHNRSFAIVRSDGSTTDFSYLKCITPPRPEDVFKQTCRRVIEDQIVEYKRQFFAENADARGRVKCSVTGKWVDFANAHVDHMPPTTFEALVTRFVRRHKINMDGVEIIGFADGEVIKQFADPELSALWAEFHRRHASLRVVSRAANLSIIKRQTLPPKARRARNR